MGKRSRERLTPIEYIKRKKRAIKLTTFRQGVGYVLLFISSIIMISLFVLPPLSKPILAALNSGPNEYIEPDTTQSINSIDYSQKSQVTLNIDGKGYNFRTDKTIVGDILRDIGVSIPFNKGIYPDLNQTLNAGQIIYIGDIETKTLVEDETTTFRTVEQKDESLDKGVKKTIQEGSDGLVRNTYIVQTVANKEISRNSFSSEVIKELKNHIIGIGYIDQAGCPKISPNRGAVYCRGHKETYYNLDMHYFSGFGTIIRREDGAKVYGDGKWKGLILLACHTKYRYQVRLTSIGRGICVDTGGFATNNPEQIDIATFW